MIYLREESHYTEVYDHGTVVECRHWVAQDIAKKLGEKIKASKDKELQEQYKQGVAIPNILYIIQGERFRRKAETVREWMERDRQKEEKVANAVQPVDIRCLRCGLTMECTDRELCRYKAQPEERVRFTFMCSNCKRGRGIWEGGEEWKLPPTPCPKCQTHMTSTDKRVGNVVTTTYACPNCKHKEADRLDLDEKYVAPVDPHFEEDRKKYCMSNTEGYDYVTRMDGIKRLLDEWKYREQNKTLFELKAKIKTLTIAELQSLLNPITQKAGYTNFVLGKPDLLRGVTVEFATQDTHVGRSQYDSIQALKKLIEHAVAQTNWRLMSDGISYRLGFLTGRLRGVEGEDELLELAKKSLKNETR
jgi:hypothetical protein